MIIKNLGLCDYQQTLVEMQTFTKNRNKNTTDELWIVEHNSIFTHGISSKDSHILTPNNIPTIRTDRGGQITYHGNGQLIIYLLLDLKKLKLGVKKIVENIEEAIILLLKDYKIKSQRKPSAPGVYVEVAGELQKIAALGLKIKNGKTYHGLSLNINMDLSPFYFINPCGYTGLKVCQMSDFITQQLNLEHIGLELCKKLKALISNT